MGQHAQVGLAGCFSVDEYEADLVKKHEKTRRHEDDRTRHISTLRAQTGLVFLTYRASREVDAIVEAVTAGEPVYDHRRRRDPAHDLACRWRAARPARRGVRPPAAPLHRRRPSPRASAARTRAKLRAEGASLDPEKGDWNWFLAVAFPHDQMQVLPYHRVVRDLSGRTPEAFLAALGERFRVLPGPPIPSRKGLVGVYLAGRWHTLELPATPAGSSTIAGLDVSKLQEGVLAPLLGIEDPRTDKRIDFVGGIRVRASSNGASTPADGRRLRFLPCHRRGAHGHRRRGRHHAAEVDLVRTEAARRSPDPRVLIARAPAGAFRVGGETMKVLVADKFEKSGLEGLKAAGCEVIFEPDLKEESLREAIGRTACDVLVVRSTKVPEPMLDAGQLSLVVRAGAGVDNIDVKAPRRGIFVANCPGKNSGGGGRFAFGLILALDRRILTTSPSCAPASGTRRRSFEGARPPGTHARAARLRFHRPEMASGRRRSDEHRGLSEIGVEVDRSACRSTCRCWSGCVRSARRSSR